MVFVKIDKQTGLVLSRNSSSVSPDPSLFIEVETDFNFSNNNNDYRWNSTDSTFYDVGTKPEVVIQSAQLNSPFTSKYIYVDGVKKSLFKRVHGCSETIASGATVNIDFTIPYDAVKFTGANIFGGELKDTLNFYILDTVTNTYSKLDVRTYGANFKLNQFGFDVEMPPTGSYENISSYDADLYKDMIVRCEYTNNGGSSKYISMNLWIHEVK